MHSGLLGLAHRSALGDTGSTRRAVATVGNELGPPMESLRSHWEMHSAVGLTLGPQHSVLHSGLHPH
jgi:hypothetical protein